MIGQLHVIMCVGVCVCGAGLQTQHTEMEKQEEADSLREQVRHTRDDVKGKKMSDSKKNSQIFMVFIVNRL